MYLDALIPGDETEDIVAEDRIAALGHLVVQSLEVLGVDHQYVVAAARLESGPDLSRIQLGSPGHRLRYHGVVLLDEGLDGIDVHRALVYGGVERVYGRVVELLHHLHHHLVREVQLPVLQTPLQQFLALGGLLVFGIVQGLAYLVPGLGSHHIVHPIRGRLLVLAAEDFHHVARLELLLDGGYLAVDASSRAPDTEVAVYAEGEIQHGRTRRQRPEFTARREDENLLVGRLGQVLRIQAHRMFEVVSHRTQPSVKALFVLNALV